MSDILCIYYSRTGHTRRAIKEIAEALDAEVTAITDDTDRSGWRGYIRCGMDAMKTSTKPLQPFRTEKPLEEYKLVIVGSPVWAGRCASPIRALLKRRGLEMGSVALSEKMQQFAARGASQLTFLIGSSFGLDENLKKKADLRLSMSPMTFPHHLARVMLLEQVYRAYQIEAGTKYHK